ncbi:MAG: response regulator [Gemmatimonadota bacterium]
MTTLLEASDFTVDAVSDGTAALELLAGSVGYDLILLDIMMPGATGLEVLEQLRAMPTRAATPVMILTAKGQDADRERAFSLGASDFVTKPFSPKKLLARIDQLLHG